MEVHPLASSCVRIWFKAIVVSIEDGIGHIRVLSQFCQTIVSRRKSFIGINEKDDFEIHFSQIVDVNNNAEYYLRADVFMFLIGFLENIQFL